LEVENAGSEPLRPLGGAFAIAAVVDHFSDALISNPIVGPELGEPCSARVAHEQPRQAARAQVHADAVGLRHLRRAADYAATEPGSTALGLEEAHRDLKISPGEFDEVAAELTRTLDHFGVPDQEKEEVLGAFAAHKDEVTEGHSPSRRRLDKVSK
jgi:hemoglobin